jgi:hypothetical protein
MEEETDREASRACQNEGSSRGDLCQSREGEDVQKSTALERPGGEDERDGEAVCHADDDLGDGVFGLAKTLLVIGRHSAGRGSGVEQVSADAGPELQWNK